MTILEEVTTSMWTLYLLAEVALVLLLAYAFSRAIYNIYFHPLAAFPGPRLAAATKLPVAYASLSGRLPVWLHELHTSYASDVIRTSPDELSFTAPAAWRDMYAQIPGRKAFPKDQRLFVGINSIITANDADHSRLRRILAHAFSDKALREQEPLLQTHVAAFVAGMCEQIAGPSGGTVDLSPWFSWFTFDVIGDLSFGESFNCLRDERLHPWVAALFKALQFVVFASVTMQFPPLDRALQACIPKSMLQGRNTLLGHSSATVNRRLNRTTDRKDFMHYILKQTDDKGMSMAEIHGNAASLIVAGGETSSGILAGTTYLLLSHPEHHARLVREIRSACPTPADLTVATLTKLPFLQAVLDEAFRVYPPGLQGQPRKIPPGGGEIAGYRVPEGTGVQLNQYPANHSAANFTDAEAFVPARWMGDARYADDRREAVQPFSVGARNCIGKNLANAEIRLLLATLLWHFDLSLSDATDPDWKAQKAWFVWQRKPLVVRVAARVFVAGEKEGGGEVEGGGEGAVDAVDAVGAVDAKGDDRLGEGEGEMGIKA
ncbi:hypothetical protein MMC18_006959 [Xylographa bjoerkii]|nr:hypothetical protein [Xylographa bjoerkii]